MATDWSQFEAVEQPQPAIDMSQFEVVESAEQQPFDPVAFQRESLAASQKRVAEENAQLPADASLTDKLMSRASRALDLFTGAERETRATRELQPLTSGGLLSGTDISGPKAAAIASALLVTPDPGEAAKILQSASPDIGIQYDEAGNIIAANNKTGVRVVINEPGLSKIDLMQALGLAAAFTPAGRAATIPGALAAGAGTQVAIEGLQKTQGGTFDETDVALAGGVQAIIPGLGAVVRGARSAFAPLPQQAAEIIETGARSNVPVMTSDIIQPETFVGRSAQALGERVPVIGTGPQRAAQQTARQNAIQQFADDVGATTGDRLDVAMAQDLIGKRRADLGRYAGMKDEVFTRLDNAGAVPTANATAKANEAIAKLEGIGKSVPQEAVAAFRNFADDIQGKGIREVEELRKILGERLKAPELASARGIADKQATEIYRALNQDIGDHITTTLGGRARTKWEVANKRLSELAGEAKNARLRKALNEGDATPENVERMLFSSNRSDVERLTRNLSPTGRAAAKTAVIKRAYDQAVTDGVVSPEKFRTALGKLSNQIGVVMSDADRKAVDGFAKLLQATSRAGRAGVVTETGQQTYLPVVWTAIGATLGLKGAAAAAGGIGGLARVYESPAVRNYLIKLSATPRLTIESEARKLIPAIQSAAQMLAADQQNEAK